VNARGDAGGGRYGLSRNSLLLSDGSDLLVVLGDLQHRPFRYRIVELLRDATRLLSVSPPVRRIVQKRWRWHVRLTQAAGCGSGPI
jgi:hypothetical protein